MSDTSGHTHQYLKDRLTAEMAMIRTEIGALGGRIGVLERDIAGLRIEMHRGFADLRAALRGELRDGLTDVRGEMHSGFTTIGQTLEHILARLPEPPG